MTVSIKLNGVGFTTYLNTYKAAGDHPSQGQFNDGSMSGSKYASTEKYAPRWYGHKSVLDGDTSKFGFVAETATGYFDHSFWDNVLSGSLGKLSVGQGVKADYTLAQNFIEFNFHGLQSEGSTGAVHKILSSLKKPVANSEDLIVEINKHDTVQCGTPANETFKAFAKHDIFYFPNRSVGHDTITCFDSNNASPSHDVLKFSTYVFANAREVLAATRFCSGDAIITIDPLNTITLKGVVCLNTGDFAFI